MNLSLLISHVMAPIFSMREQKVPKQTEQKHRLRESTYVEAREEQIQPRRRGVIESQHCGRIVEKAYAALTGECMI